MTSVRMERLALSSWPFVILAPGEILGALLIRRTNPVDRLGLPDPVADILVVLGGLVLSMVCIVVARRLVERSRSVWWRSMPGAVVIYVFVAVLSGLFMMLILVDRGPSGQPAVLSVLYMITRPVNILILAVVVQLLRDGINTTRAVNAITRNQLLLVRQTNEMIEAAEAEVRAESLKILGTQVARPLRSILRDGPRLSNEELADRLDGFIEAHLRPMAHVLHPVSVRLGLISAMRSLNPDVLVDASPTVERMDADGILLDEEVRLQLYRWIRGALPSEGPSRAAIVIRERELEVSLHPAVSTPVDAVQAAAGIRFLGPGLVSAPLRGQVADVLPREPVPVDESTQPGRYRVRDLLTVPLPDRLLLVVMLTLASAPLQFVVYRWTPSWGSILASVACALAPIAVTVLLNRLPTAPPTLPGAMRVVAGWLVVAAAGGVALAATATFFGILPAGMVEWVLILFRMSYRYAVPGILVTLSYGLVVRAQQRLDDAQRALEIEERRRIDILAEARQLDRDVSEALHRTVQGRLAAAVIMLRLGERNEAWTQVVEMASVEVLWLRERMGAGHVGDGLVAEPPLGLMVIQVDDIPVDEETFGLLARVVGEVAVNARRHGGASTLMISVNVDQGRWQIICEDDGSGILEPAPPGLGSRLLDDATAALGGSWRIEAAHPGSRVVLDLPLSIVKGRWPRARVRASSLV